MPKHMAQVNERAKIRPCNKSPKCMEMKVSIIPRKSVRKDPKNRKSISIRLKHKHGITVSCSYSMNCKIILLMQFCKVNDGTERYN